MDKENQLKEAAKNINHSIELIGTINQKGTFENSIFVWKPMENGCYTTINNIIHPNKQIAEVYQLAGAIYAKLGEYEKSLCYYKRAQYYLIQLKGDFDNLPSISVYTFRGCSNSHSFDDIKNNQITVSPSWKMNDPFDSVINLWADEKLLSKNCKEQTHVKPFSESFKKFRIRSFCYGDEKNIVSKILMWSHYAEEHKGYCIKYNLSKHFIKQESNDGFEHMFLKKIKYTDREIAIDAPSIDTDTAFATKSKEWIYENEVRLIAYLPNNEEEYKCIKLDINSYVESIYFGYKCENTTIQKVKAIFANAEKKPSFFKMELNPNDIYSLNIRRHYCPVKTD